MIRHFCQRSMVILVLILLFLCSPTFIIAGEKPRSQQTVSSKSSSENILSFEDQKDLNILLERGREMKKKDLPKAIAYFQEIYNLSLKYHEISFAADISYEIGKSYILGLDYYNGLKYLLNSYQLFIDVKSPLRTGYILIEIGNCYFYFMNYTLAQRYYRWAEEIFISYGNPFGEAVVLNNLGLIKQKTDESDSAFFFFEKALRMRISLGTPALIGHSYYYFGSEYFRKNQFQEAESFLNKALPLLLQGNIQNQNLQYDFKRTIAGTHYLLGKIYSAENKNQEAIRHFDSALVMFRKIYDFNKMPEVYLAMGDFFLKQNHPQKANDIYQKALTLSDSLHDLLSIKACYRAILNKYMVFNQFDSLKMFYSHYNDISDSIDNQLIVNRYTDIQHAIEFNETENQARILKQQNTTYTIYFLASGIIFLLIISIVLLLNYYQRKRYQRFKQLSNSIFEGVLFYNKSMILDFNHKFIELTGYSESELKGKSISMLIPGEYQNKAKEFFKITVESYCILPIMTKNGILLQVEIQVHPLPIKHRKINVAVFRDITQRVQTEEDQKRLTRELQELNKSKDRFISIIAHDLRSPFNALMGFADLAAEESATSNNPDLIKYIGTLQQISRGSLELLEDLLTWSRLQLGRIPLQMEKINLFQEVNMVVNILLANAMKKEIRLSNAVDKQVFVFADNNMVQSILRNLLSNAIKFTRQGGLIEINSKAEEKYITVSVKDNGVGIPSQVMARLFTEDGVFSTRGTDNERGTGMGLSLCKEMTEKNEGSIWVESEPDNGTCFFFTLLSVNN